MKKDFCNFLESLEYGSDQRINLNLPDDQTNYDSSEDSEEKCLEPKLEEINVEPIVGNDKIFSETSMANFLINSEEEELYSS